MGHYAPTGPPQAKMGPPQAVMGLPPQAVMGLTQVGGGNLMRQTGPTTPKIASGQVTTWQAIRLPEKKSERIRF